jgi:hypothetical protein
VRAKNQPSDENLMVSKEWRQVSQNSDEDGYALLRCVGKKCGEPVTPDTLFSMDDSLYRAYLDFPSVAELAARKGWDGQGPPLMERNVTTGV